jgi:hypothetical protein
MSENTNTNTEIEIEIEETEATVLTLDTLTEVITELTSEAAYTPYKVATVINKVFLAVGFEKTIPTQMMYNYSRNGLINKVKGAKSFTQTEVQTFVLKYTRKQLGL